MFEEPLPPPPRARETRRGVSNSDRQMQTPRTECDERALNRVCDDAGASHSDDETSRGSNRNRVGDMRTILFSVAMSFGFIFVAHGSCWILPSVSLELSVE